MTQCKYRSEIGEVQCEEQALPDSPNGFCIFHEGLENKNIDECMKAFYEKIITGKTNFEGFILKDLNFSQAGITQIGNEDSPIWFNNAKFHGIFLANGIKFIGFTSFSGAEFHGDADFGNTSFLKEAIFDNAKFFAKADFLLADFFRESRFSNVSFCETSNYANATFRGPAFFSGAEFSKVAVFRDSVFERGGSFTQAKMDFALFENSELKNVSFDEINLTNFKFHGAKLKEANLSGAIWKSPWSSPWRKFILREDIETSKARRICKECSAIVIDDSSECDHCGRYFVSIDKYFSCPKCNTKNKSNSKECINKKCNAIFSTKIKNKNLSDGSYRASLFKIAEDVYRNIKLNLQNEGDYKTAGEFNFNELIMRRKRSFRERNFLDWFFSHLNSKLCGYGERADRVITGSLVVIFSLAAMFFINNAIVKQGFASYSPDFLECLYFSFVTFTTLGYGDYAPSQTFQLVATAEAFFGAFMIALFVLVFGRKMLR